MTTIGDVCDYVRKLPTVEERDYRKLLSEIRNIHMRGLRLSMESYIVIANNDPDFYDSLPDDIKSQELELASKL